MTIFKFFTTLPTYLIVQHKDTLFIKEYLQWTILVNKLKYCGLHDQQKMQIQLFRLLHYSKQYLKITIIINNH